LPVFGKLPRFFVYSFSYILTASAQELPRNPGTELDLDWALSVQANTSAIERRCLALPGRRSIKKSHQAAWLLKAITCIDLTTLSGDDTESRVRRLCQKAKFPVQKDVLKALDIEPGTITTGAICVYHDMVKGSSIRP
jgi:deoxyribose-phosphate aldolase